MIYNIKSAFLTLILSSSRFSYYKTNYIKCVQFRVKLKKKWHIFQNKMAFSQNLKQFGQLIAESTILPKSWMYPVWRGS